MLVKYLKQQNRPQTGALEHTEHAVSSYPAGDANSNIYPPQYPPTTSSNTTHQQKPLKTHEYSENPISTASKASVKSEDDFDVNEYFARLHGTRYVSAPINSALKEDANANLEATEENLEEINLNEPEKQDVQQSLTADIAQNFSQLPTVLPQMASAVFSSFSNMLQTRKSREPTPEVSSGYVDVQFERPSEPVKEVMPPPRDLPKEPLGVPPSFGTSNYRLPPKKKYAQIPGLSSGDTAQSPYQPYSQSLPPTNQNMPQYFVPSSISSEQNAPGPQNLQHTNISQAQTVQSSVPTYFTPASESSEYKMDPPKSTETVSQTDMPNVAAQNIPDLKFRAKDDATSNFPPSQPQFYSQEASQATVLPPPPMFANQPRKDSQTGAGKSVLPPSVARRIGANQPIIKQTYQVPSFNENIFVPTLDSSENVPSKSETVMQPPASMPQPTYPPFNAQSSLSPSSTVQSSFLPYSGYLPTAGTINLPPTSIPSAATSTGSRPSVFPPNTTLPSSGTRPTEVAGPPSSILMQSSVAPPPLFANPKISTSPSEPFTLPPSNQMPLNSPMTTGIPSNSQMPSQKPPSFFTPNSSTSTAMLPPPPATVTPQIFSPANNFETLNTQAPVVSSSHQGTLPPPPLFNPVPTETKEFPPINMQTAPTPEPPKSVTEPPKASGPTNFRMTKKRPQYYAGPIEGVGAISNNVKPVIAPVNTGNFQGALFTPQQDNSVGQTTQNIGQYVEPVPFDISRPAETPYSNVAVQPQTQNYNTAFDMSRPAMETYTEPKQEYSGFGLLGSLKSKLGSLDINKIQSTVTTFFDPAYNDTKKDISNKQEPVSYGQQQYSQYGNTQGSNFEVFVPQVEQTSQPYGYADKYRHQDPIDIRAPEQFDAAAANQAAPQNETNTHVEKSKEEINASRQPDIEIQKLHSTFSPHQLNEPQPLSTQHTFHSGAPQSTQSSAMQNELRIADNIRKSETVSSTTKLSTEASNFFNTPMTFISKDVNSSEIQKIIDNVSHGYASTTTSIEVKHSAASDDLSKPKAKETNEYNLSGQPTSYIESCQVNEPLSKHSFDDVTNISSDSGLSFFDTPTSQIFSKEGAANVLSLDNIDKSFGAAASFFSSPFKDEPLSLNFDTPKNIGFEIANQFKKDTEEVEDKTDGDVKNIMTDLQTNASDFFSSLNPGDSKMQSIFSSAFDFNKSDNQEQQTSQVITDWPEEIRPINKSSAPLFGMSTMLANKTKELHDLETEMKNITLDEPVNEPSYFENVIPEETETSELDICETCREVNKPEEWERDEPDDLTTQLIENITSPIQLLNPVEVPLTEADIDILPDNELDEFDKSQCAEICHITEETIEAIQVQAASELLDDDQKIRDYGWSKEEVTYPVKALDERDYTFEQPTGLEQHNYGLAINPNAIGFFGNKLYDTIPNKVKADFESKQNITMVLPRQMSIPSAPPAEDAKNEALDVHSIEQDASKDFPIYEEFVIEPEDGDKSDESESDGPKADTFSSRVDKYKKNEENDALSKVSPTFNLTSTTSPTIMPSYFDTGNYAAETHYRKLSSPTSNITFEQQNQSSISVPPGFEEEFRKRLSVQEAIAAKTDDSFKVPDTTTQTRPTYSPTFSTSHLDTFMTTASAFSSITTRGSENINLPDFKSVFGSIGSLSQETKPAVQIAQKIENPMKSDFVPQAVDDVGTAKPDITSGTSVFGAHKLDEKPQPVQLPDPMNFFASSLAAPQNSDTQDLSFNRLASYFSAPEQPDHSKSFFELSQSQKHYRQEPEANLTRFNTTGDSQNASNPVLSGSNPDDKLNIPHDQYVANFKLMHDLTKIQPEFKPEQVVRTVNYFTIEYDNEHLGNDTLKPKQALNKPFENDIKHPDILDEGVIDDNSLVCTLNMCKHCCDLTVGHVSKIDNIHHECVTDFKVKKCMDSNSGATNSNAMDPRGRESSIQEPNAQVTVNIGLGSKEQANDEVSIATESRVSSEYTPVRHHWFYRVDVDNKSNWRGFSVADSKALEDAFLSLDDFRATTLQLIQSHYKEAYNSGRIGRVEIQADHGWPSHEVLSLQFDPSKTTADEQYKAGLQHQTSTSVLTHRGQGSPRLDAAHRSDKQYVSGAAGTGQPSVQYPRLNFEPVAMYALGSPIAIFECIRGVDTLGTHFKLPTCKHCFNIFHPYDPIAYRIEPLINPSLRDYKPHQIPHHKGRKRMHLELKDTMARVGADIKQKLIESFRSTWTSMWKTTPPANDTTLEKLTPEMLGALNNGRRVDYVLQEAPFEMINEYLSSMTSHVCYWTRLFQLTPEMLGALIV
ncbi:DDHD domain-containing protein [Phthorimaea operculella]|nr:DDHD domain-containing protein [Phthorimaea operculella]